MPFYIYAVNANYKKKTNFQLKPNIKLKGFNMFPKKWAGPLTPPLRFPNFSSGYSLTFLMGQIRW